MNSSSTYIQISYLYVSSNLFVKCRKCFVNGFKEKLLKTDSIEDLLFFNICLKDRFLFFESSKRAFYYDHWERYIILMIAKLPDIRHNK